MLAHSASASQLSPVSCVAAGRRGTASAHACGGREVQPQRGLTSCTAWTSSAPRQLACSRANPLPTAQHECSTSPTGSGAPEPIHMDTTPNRAALPRRCSSCSSVTTWWSEGGRQRTGDEQEGHTQRSSVPACSLWRTPVHHLTWRAPVQPSGCPSAMAPPFGLTLAGSMPRWRTQ